MTNDPVEFRYIPHDARLKIPDDDFGYVDTYKKLYPIEFAEDISAAAKLIDKAGLSETDKKNTKARLARIAKRKGFDYPSDWQINMSSDMQSQLAENILFSAEPEDTFNIKVDKKVYTLKVVEVTDTTEVN